MAYTSADVADVTDLAAVADVAGVAVIGAVVPASFLADADAKTDAYDVPASVAG